MRSQIKSSVFSSGRRIAVALFLISAGAHASVSQIPQFVPPGEFAIGFEPELTLSRGAGLAATLKYTHGITDLNNLSVILGTGDGPRQFRFGGDMTFDFFPDIDKQPGIGIAAQAIYYRLASGGAEIGQFEITGVPYIHKAFQTGGSEVQPYLAVPIGYAFTQGTYHAVSQIAVGSLFKQSEHLRYSVEFGFNVNRSDSYMSGGIIYYH